MIRHHHLGWTLGVLAWLLVIAVGRYLLFS